ncbi:hypothetical protein ACJO2E_14780 [Marinobacter sp. M1N3S26]|uniref:hypothetical protein n=1 Tax=Marinobacter sp. M1N3S26 TaxID=3382299 RepID=UPI00387AA55F
MGSPSVATRPSTLTNLELRRKVARLPARDFAFSCISSGRSYLRTLDARLQNPETVRQGNAPLCGPAAFMYCVAKSFPRVYERYALELALEGNSKIGQLLVTPSSACRNATDSIGLGGISIPALDWVTLAGLRDSTNAWFRMRNPGSNVSGITFPGAMMDWFQGSGLFTNCEDHSSLVTNPSLNNLLNANQKFLKDHYVCLFIRAAILTRVGGELAINKFDKGTPKTIAPTPDHWIVQRTKMDLDNCTAPFSENVHPSDPMDCRLDFSVASWGAPQGIPINDRIHNLTPTHFLRYYYGFISAFPERQQQ